MGSGGGASAAEVEGRIPGECGGGETVFQYFQSLCEEDLHRTDTCIGIVVLDIIWTRF